MALPFRCYYCTALSVNGLAAALLRTFACACARMNMLRVNSQIIRSTQSHRQRFAVCACTARNFIVAASSTIAHTYNGKRIRKCVACKHRENRFCICDFFFSSFSSHFFFTLLLFLDGWIRFLCLICLSFIRVFVGYIQFAPVRRLCMTSIVRHYEFSWDDRAINIFAWYRGSGAFKSNNCTPKTDYIFQVEYICSLHCIFNAFECMDFVQIIVLLRQHWTPWTGYIHYM